MCYLSYIVLIMVYTRTDFRWINCYYNFFNEAVVKERCNLFLKVFLEETKRIVIFKKKTYYIDSTRTRKSMNKYSNIILFNFHEYFNETLFLFYSYY